MDVLLQIKNLCKMYGTSVIFNNASFNINEKQKIGVVGKNGAGKSTLFKIITGKEEKDSGLVNIPSYTKIGYLEQYDPFSQDEIVIEFLQRYTKQEKWKCEKQAGQFNIKKDKLEKEIRELSGGYQMRIKLIAMLLFEPNLLLLDEPTNYLDLNTLILLEKFLKNCRASFLIISHDREFLKNTCNITLEVDRGETTLYKGDIEEYLEYKNKKIDTETKQNTKIERKQKHLQKFVDRFGAKATLAKSAKSKEKQINKLEKDIVKIKSDFKKVKINIPNIEEKKGVILKTFDLKIGYKDKEVANNINLEFNSGKKIAILGENGEGKSTFLKTISNRLENLSGKYKWKNNINIDYYSEDILKELNEKETIETYLKSFSGAINKGEIYKMASNFLFEEDDLGKPVSILSGGERARLCLAGLLLTKNEVLLLDEPTNHLDFETEDLLSSALKKCNKTIFFISHDRYFIRELATNILEIKNKKIVHHKRNYEDYLYFLKLNSKEVKNINEDNYKENKIKKVNNNQKTREYTKERSKIENENKKLQEEKDKILMEFAKNISKEETVKLSKKLNELEKELQKNEENWLKIEEKIEKLKNNNIDN
ncbi:ATP-binding cassette domain-containing protein [Patescibacteria group bacterium]|nr:ATP-binding cassette domain-containing protein [Patescibacteria group bacterium]